MANKLKQKLGSNTKFYYGWVIVALCSLSYFFSGPGQTYFISVFIDHYIADFGWNRSTISSLYSIATLIAGFLLFLVGRFTDKFGQKKIIIVMAFVLGLACLLNSFVVNLAMLFVGFFLARIAGQGSMTLLPSTLLPNWFVKKRALVFSAMSLGNIIASAALPPLNSFLINSWGWQDVWRLWTLLLWAFFIPLVWLFLYNKPKELGLKKYTETKPQESLILKPEIENQMWTLKEAMKTHSFWGMLYCQILIPLINTGLVFHFISIWAAKGLSPLASSMVLSTLAIVSFPSALVAGFVFDKLKMNHPTVVICILLLSSLTMLFFATSIFTAIAFAILQGIAMGFQSVNGGIVWPNYYGTKSLGSIRGIVMTATVLASALGPIPLGIAYDLFGRYNEAILLLMLLPLIGIVAALFSTKPVKKSQ